jgi:hypothetical protein
VLLLKRDNALEDSTNLLTVNVVDAKEDIAQVLKAIAHKAGSLCIINHTKRVLLNNEEKLEQVEVSSSIQARIQATTLASSKFL